MSLHRESKMGFWLRGTLPCMLLALSPMLRAQAGSAQRVFPQSRITIEDVLKSISASLSGHLPTLDGFAAPAKHSLDQYERGYFQAAVQVEPTASGGSLVRVTVKITAWYNDAEPSRSGYQLLKSNGRIEADVLDQLSEQLTANAPAVPSTPQPGSEQDAGSKAVGDANGPGEKSSAMPQKEAAPPAVTQNSGSGNNGSLISAPSPRFSDSGTFSSSITRGLSEQVDPAGPPKAVPGKSDGQLQAEVEGLEEVLKNQAHPNNLVAVRKSDTPVVAAPSLTAKTLFLASQHDEFEILDFN
jgi:hypothetical protein